MMPSRVGRSPALDTALEAFYHSHVEDGFNEASLVSVRKHGRALRALRSELIAGNEVTRTELMIAVYLTLVTEVNPIIFFLSLFPLLPLLSLPLPRAIPRFNAKV